MFQIYKKILFIFSKNKKINNNWISLTHSLIICCHLNKNNYDTLKYMSVGYFLTDIWNYNRFTILWIHHILTPLLLRSIDKNYIDIEIFIQCYRYVEFGNFPLYILWFVDKSNIEITKKYYTGLLLWELGWFFFFRIFIVTILSFLTNSYYTFFLNIAFQCANINWSYGIYKKIKRQ